jgi:hypothetical protein
MKRFYWRGFSNEERAKAISDITSIIGSYAIILNSHMYSDLSLNLVLEIDENKIAPMYKKLIDVMRVDGYVENDNEAVRECIILFDITFIKSSGNLRIEVPAVPG